MKLAIVLVSSLVVVAAARPASAEATHTVRGFFSALEQHDFPGALALTSGDASVVIHDLLADIERQAALHHADVELHVRELCVTEPAATDAGDGGIDVRFAIDVVGKKWLFRRVARTLSGSARFYVDEHAPRIVAIVGALER